MRRMNGEIFIQAMGILVTLILGIAQLRTKHPTQALKDALKDDLDILNKMKPDDFGYKIVQDHVKLGIISTYTVDRKHRFHIYNWDDLLIGAFIAGFFTYWSLIHLEQGSNWGFLTAFFAIVGFSMIPDAFQKNIEESTEISN